MLSGGTNLLLILPSLPFLPSHLVILLFRSPVLSDVTVNLTSLRPNRAAAAVSIFFFFLLVTQPSAAYRGGRKPAGFSPTSCAAFIQLMRFVAREQLGWTSTESRVLKYPLFLAALRADRLLNRALFQKLALHIFYTNKIRSPHVKTVAFLILFKLIFQN